jgi:hypothetical protein
LMWQMSVVLTDISWTVEPATACVEAVDGHTCFLLLTAATNTCTQRSPRPGQAMMRDESSNKT